LLGGKITFVHRRLWPALVRLADRLEPERLASVQELHTSRGTHARKTTPFPDWVPADVLEAAACLSASAAQDELAAILELTEHSAR
jgi:hypothetical protein